MQKLFILLALFLGTACILPMQAQNNGNVENRTTEELKAHLTAQIERAVAKGSTILERLEAAVTEKDIESATVLQQDMLALMKAEVDRRGVQLEQLGQAGPSEATKQGANILSRMKIIFESSVAYKFTTDNAPMKDETTIQRMQEFLDLMVQ